LDSYLKEEDFKFAESELLKLLKEAKNRHKIILLTNLVNLSEIDSFQVGNVLIRRIDDKYLKGMPEKVNSEFAGGLIGGLLGYSKKEDFIKENNINMWVT